ncbi:protein kinase domain-containing protein [Undibacterium sp. Di24W]|uniref:serine/threonine-protein kinase n=1 Tax=Undibacterium sp. Di24W TaxID=3413033 RepID=UPI003BF36F66
MPASTDNVINTKQLLHYQLGESLGEGGFGQVFSAWDTKLHRQVAIKYLKNIAAGVDLVKEARLAASLQHPAFVKVHALEQTDQSQAIVMELVPGRTLRQLMETQPPSAQEAIDIIRQIAQAMQEAHSAGLIHGDLKPSNLMQEPGGVIRILDFGLATQADRDATTSLVQSDPQGTIAYMAPELLTGSTLRPSADIYALGVIFYELLTGARPFSNLSGLALAAALMQSNSDQWPWPDDLPLSLRQLVRVMTARQMDQRLESMKEVALQCAHLAALDPPSLRSLSLDLKSLKLAAIPNPTPREIDWRQLRKPMLRGFIGLSLFAGLIGLWYSQPYWQKMTVNLQAYSEAQEMQQGLQALAYFDQHAKIDEAEQHFVRILSRSPENAAAMASMSLIYSSRFANNGQDVIWLQKAEASAQQALKFNDFLAISHIANAKVFSLRDQYSQALAELERGLALDPNSHLAWSLKVDVLIRAKRLDEALQLATQGAQRFSQECLFPAQLGQIYALQGNYKEALDAYGLSIKLKPDVSNGYIGLAQVLMRQNKADDAVATLQSGLKVYPSAELSTALGNVLFARGDYVAATAAFETAVTEGKGNPNDDLGWAKLADTLSWLPGRSEAANKAYDKARSILAEKLIQSPNNVDLLSRMALYAAKLGAAGESQIKLQKALSLAPDNPEVQFRAAVSYEILGKRGEALAALVKAKSLGYPSKSIEAEPELLALRRDPKYLQP